MARRKRKMVEGSLDSLLDTMTNVVGILVILMAVTQFGVGDAVRRILTRTDAQLRDVTDEAINAARDQQAELNLTLNQVTERWEELRRALPGEQASLTEIERVTNALRDELATPLDDTRVSRTELEKQLEKDKAEAADLHAKMLRAEAELEQVKAQLAKAPEYKPVAPKIISLPNPREAPKGKREMVIFCRDGRVYPVDEDGLARIGMLHLDRANPQVNDDGKHDCKSVREYFAKRRLGDQYFRLRVEVHNYQPFLVLDRLADSGDSAEEINGPDSRFRDTLAHKSSDDFYLRFRVWPDSYDAYVAARQAADEMGWQAGWEPQTRTDEWKIRLGDDMLCVGKEQRREPEPDDGKGTAGADGSNTTPTDVGDDATDPQERPTGNDVID